MFNKINLSKKVWIPLVIVCAVVLAFAIIFPIVYCTALKVDLKAKAVQVDQSQTINVTWDTSKTVDKVKIEVYHGNDLISEETTTRPTDIIAGEKSVQACYGKIIVKVTIKKGIYTTTEKIKLNVFADEYNIAPITATMPVTLFSLSLDEVTDSGRIPTFVWFKRSGAWDWNNLPENVYPMPNATTDEFLHSDEVRMYAKTTEYVKELHEINKDSKFHFYYNDYYAYGFVQATIANGLPKENYNIVLLSDGTASFLHFNNHFDNENAQAEYDKMAKDWEKLKSQVAKKGKYTKNTNVAIKADKLREYAYVIATEEENVEWWLTRINGTLATNNPDFYAQVASNEKVKVRDLNTLLNGIINDSSENPYVTVASLKKLYKFSDNMFEKAEKENKEVMVILGTWTDTENATNFDEYVKATIAYYGDKYVYYYKGHPKNPTNSVKGKLEHLNALGLIDVDSTIPAELIFFFNPEAFCSGYSSTTFVSLTAEKSCAIFGQSKDGCTESYKDNLDVFMTKVDNGYQGIVTGDNCILLEFPDSSNIAIYNPYNNTLKKYSNNGTEYIEIA